MKSVQFLYADGRTDKMKITDVFPNFAGAFKMRYYLLNILCTLDNCHKTDYNIYHNMNNKDM